ncbi:hypothetical protein [Kitasatospora aureofaciens]|uniref:hypothetical protein n=1 Tax=Kitasatospora aureofaciens TaxID=1894 RepID=UPI001C46ADCB|nr:hypothetical protein [Kitasatospora aureofaciens]MBV6700529.1 hypothetical protein [Kitasatospora aureofaciens]
MPHSFLGVPAVFWPSVGYLAVYGVLALAAARELRAGTSAANAVRQWTAVIWTMPGFLLALAVNPFRDGTPARFLSATALGAAGNAALLALIGHAAGSG